jgi:hypothetical protein
MNGDGCKRLVASVTASATDREEVHVNLSRPEEECDENGRCVPEAKLFEPTLLARVRLWFHA